MSDWQHLRGHFGDDLPEKAFPGRYSFGQGLLEALLFFGFASWVLSVALIFKRFDVLITIPLFAISIILFIAGYSFVKRQRDWVFLTPKRFVVYQNGVLQSYAWHMLSGSFTKTKYPEQRSARIGVGESTLSWSGTKSVSAAGGIDVVLNGFKAMPEIIKCCKKYFDAYSSAVHDSNLEITKALDAFPKLETVGELKFSFRETLQGEKTDFFLLSKVKKNKWCSESYAAIFLVLLFELTRFSMLKDFFVGLLDILRGKDGEGFLEFARGNLEAFICLCGGAYALYIIGSAFMGKDYYVVATPSRLMRVEGEEVVELNWRDFTGETALTKNKKDWQVDLFFQFSSGKKAVKAKQEMLSIYGVEHGPQIEQFIRYRILQHSTSRSVQSGDS